MPQKAKSVQKENGKIVIRKKYVENPQPLNLKICKNEVYSDIPVLDQGQVLPRGKKGKGLRILDSKIRENEEALLSMLEESQDLSDSSDSDLKDLVELK